MAELEVRVSRLTPQDDPEIQAEFTAMEHQVRQDAVVEEQAAV